MFNGSANLFSKGAILDIWDAFKVNYFAVDKDKSLICRVFLKAGMVLFCMYVKFRIIYFQMVFYTVVNKFFFINVFMSKMQISCISKFSSSTNHGVQNLRSVLQLFLLGKLMNHFWKVKLNPGFKGEHKKLSKT